MNLEDIANEILLTSSAMEKLYALADIVTTEYFEALEKERDQKKILLYLIAEVPRYRCLMEILREIAQNYYRNLNKLEDAIGSYIADTPKEKGGAA